MIQPLLHQEFESGFLPVEDSVTAMLCSLPHGPHPPPPPSRAHPARWVRPRAGVAGDAAGGGWVVIDAAGLIAFNSPLN